MVRERRVFGRWALGGVLAVASAACGAQSTEGAGGQSGGMASSAAGGSKVGPAGGSVSLGGSGTTGGASSGSGAAPGNQNTGGTGGVSMKPPNAGMGGLVLNFGGNYGGPPTPNICVPKLIGIVRDFNSALSAVNPHADFEAYTGTGITKGLVMPFLGADYAPVYADPQPPVVQLTTSRNFALWYSLTHPANARIELDLDHPPSSAGLSKTVDPGTGATTYQSAAFFPIDGKGTQAQDQVYTDGQVAHNYHFTFELNTNFIFRHGQVLSFFGNDDLWVFIDKKLAVDVGGVHSQESGQVIFDTLGLTQGQEYYLSFFYAQRHSPNSTFKLTSNVTFSNCDPIFR